MIEVKTEQEFIHAFAHFRSILGQDVRGVDQKVSYDDIKQIARNLSKREDFTLWVDYHEETDEIVCYTQ